MLPTKDSCYSQTLTQMTYSAGRGRTNTFRGGAGSSNETRPQNVLQFENWNLIENNGIRDASTFPEFLPFSVIIFTFFSKFLLLQRQVTSHPIHPRSEAGATRTHYTWYDVSLNDVCIRQ